MSLVLSGSYDDNDEVQRALDLQQKTNILRVNLTPRIDPVGHHEKLRVAAIARVRSMIDENWYGHRDLLGRSAGDWIRLFGINWTSWGENIGWGYDEAEDILKSFKASPTHYFNLTRAVYRYQAVAVALDLEGGEYLDTRTMTVKHLGRGRFWCHFFVTTSGT